MMKCMRCGKEMMNTVGGNYTCECGFAINDLVYRGGTSLNYMSIEGFRQMGWECPKCGAVMSPQQCCCVNCNGKHQISVITSTDSNGATYKLNYGFGKVDISKCETNTEVG